MCFQFYGTFDTIQVRNFDWFRRESDPDPRKETLSPPLDRIYMSLLPSRGLYLGDTATKSIRTICPIARIWHYGMILTMVVDKTGGKFYNSVRIRTWRFFFGLWSQWFCIRKVLKFTGKPEWRYSHQYTRHNGYFTDQKKCAFKLTGQVVILEPQDRTSVFLYFYIFLAVAMPFFSAQCSDVMKLSTGRQDEPPVVNLRCASYFCRQLSRDEIGVFE